jgi:DNA helicase-2/ATP-dependent DNA helicase PcrA
VSTEIFNSDQFDAVMVEAADAHSAEAIGFGMKQGEQTWLLDFGDGTGIEVRSSIDGTGLAAGTGDDSIRAWLVETKGTDRVSLTHRIRTAPLGHQTVSRTHRQPGWEKRLLEKVALLHRRRTLTGNCPKCDMPLKIWKTKKPGPNKGRLIATCRVNAHKVFLWVDKLEAAAEEKESPAVETGIPELAPVAAPVAGEGNREAVSKPHPQPVLFDLNTHQQGVVDHKIAGPSVVEAIPGSGKTRTGEEVVWNLINNNGDSPARLGYFTFSKAAASEGRRRIASRLLPDATVAEIDYLENPNGGEIKGMSASEFDDWQADPIRDMIINRVATIHALSFRLLRWNGYKLNVLAGSKWEWQEQELIRDYLDETKWEEAISAVSSWISKAVNALIQPEESHEWFTCELAKLGGPIERAGNLAEVYGKRQQFMKDNNLVDFDMMQSRVWWLINNDSRFAEWSASLFDAIVVDEAQDTSDIQTLILFHLVPNGRILFLGDVDQAMYRFRGALPAVMRRKFDEFWGTDNVTRFSLPINYRSTRNIIDWAADVITENYKEQPKYLKSFEAAPNAEAGEPVEFVEFDEFDQLAEEVAVTVKQDPGRWFFLSRTRAECSLVHMALIAGGIPAINKSGGLLLGAPHIRQVLAYLRLAVNYKDARNNEDILCEVANIASADFKAPMNHRRHEAGCNAKPWEDCGCVVLREKGVDNSHARYYGRRKVQEAGARWDRIQDQQSEEVFDRKLRCKVPTVTAKGATDFVRFVERLEGHAESATSCLQLAIHECVLPYIVAKNGIAQDDLAESSQVEDFQVLAQLITHPDQTVEQFLAQLDQLAQGETEAGDESSVLIGTIHWSKGQQRPGVIVNATRLPIVPPNVKKGKLPTGEPPTMEEERRLLYVAGTRAQDTLYVFRALEWDGQQVGEGFNL